MTENCDRVQFSLPHFEDNQSDQGPQTNISVPENLKEVSSLYSSFKKSDQISKIANQRSSKQKYSQTNQQSNETSYTPFQLDDSAYEDEFDDFRGASEGFQLINSAVSLSETDSSQTNNEILGLRSNQNTLSAFFPLSSIAAHTAAGNDVHFNTSFTGSATYKKPQASNINPKTKQQYSNQRLAPNSQPRRTKQNRYKRGYRNYQSRAGGRSHQVKIFEPSVKIHSEQGNPVHEFQFSLLLQQKYVNNSSSFQSISKSKSSKFCLDVEDIKTYGTSYLYNRKKYDKVDLSRDDIQIETNRYKSEDFESLSRVSTLNDPVLKEFFEQKMNGNVFITDVILALLMTCTKSVISWDIIVTKRDGCLAFDTRPDSKIYDSTLNESLAADFDDLNSSTEGETSLFESLCDEMTKIDFAFSQQTLLKSKNTKIAHKMHPWVRSSLNQEQAQAKKFLPSVYKYRRWKLNDDICVVGRCELNSYLPDQQSSTESSKQQEPKQLASLAHLEWNPVVQNQAKQLETNRRGLLQKEIRNNMFRVSRQAARSILAGCSYMRIGLVTRSSKQANTSFKLLANIRDDPHMFAHNINLSESSMQGIFEHIVRRLQESDIVDGSYIILRDPNNPQLLVYKLQDEKEFSVTSETVLDQDNNVEDAMKSSDRVASQ